MVILLVYHAGMEYELAKLNRYPTLNFSFKRFVMKSALNTEFYIEARLLAKIFSKLLQVEQKLKKIFFWALMKDFKVVT